MIGAFRTPAIALLVAACSDYNVVRQSFFDSFRQNERPGGVDVLWVLDDSATMYEEQQLLLTGASSFVGFLGNSTIEFQLGVVTTDMDGISPGHLVGDVMTVDTPSLDDVFMEQLTRFEVGHRTERGFDAALAAAEPGGLNPDFARSDADLEVIFFSDEDDHSSMDAASFLSSAQAGRSGQSVKAHAVVGDPPQGCASVLAAADAGYKYLEAQDASEGRRESICTDDYGPMLARVALEVVGLETTFALSKVPELKTIDVLVNDVLVHRRSRHGWTYDAGDNAIIFDGYSVPQPAALIEVYYTEWYGPEQEDTGS